MKLQCQSVSPDGKMLASGSSDKSIRFWDVKTGQQKSKLDGHSNTVYSVCFSPYGNTLASGSSDKSIRFWDVKTGQQKSKLNGHSSYVETQTPGVIGKPGNLPKLRGLQGNLGILLELRPWVVKRTKDT